MMLKLLFPGLILLVSFEMCAQLNTKDISFELRYPSPIGDNFINKGFGDGYSGLIDIGLDYTILKRKALGVGLLFNSSILRLSKTDVTLFILSPKIKIDYKIDLNWVSIIPQMAVGYSNWRFRAPEMPYTDEFGDITQGVTYKKNENGLTTKGAVKLVINNDKKIKWYFNLSYEFTKVEKTKHERGNIKFNRNIQMIYPGVGIIWNFGE